jgi:pyridoxamine 5'-phosphate oxidase
VSEDQSDEYFNIRPFQSRISAFSSPQSQVIESREALEKMVERNKKLYDAEIKRPPYWGGFIVNPELIEFWQGRPNRLHDRLQYTRQGNNWIIERLAP